jgi:hypothetical protein
LVLISDWVWQAALVTGAGQFKVIGGASSTLKVLVQEVTKGTHVFVYVNVISFLSPQAEGNPVLLLVKTPLQPPLAVTVFSQFV